MKNIIKSSLLIFLFGVLFISCEKFSYNPAFTQNNTDTTVEGRILGLWKLQNQGEDANNTLNYIFEGNKICHIFWGKNELDMNPHTFTYEIVKINGINTVVISDEKNRKTIFKINSIDESKMKVVFELIENTKQKLNRELTFVKNTSTDGY